MSIPNPVSDLASLSDAKRSLLECFLQRERPSGLTELPVIPLRPAGEPVPLSYAQEQVWLHAQMVGEIPIYNEPITIHRRGVVDVPVLERCLGQMVRRHEIWRTTFDTFDGQPVQIVHPSAETFLVPEFDLRRLPAPAKKAEARRLAEEDARRPFDLKKGPLLRAILVRLGDEQYRICMTLHHLVFDGVTASRVIVPELATLYDALSRNQSSPLPDLPIQYADFAYGQRRAVRSTVWDQSVAYWKRQLGGELPVLPWPNDHPRPPVQSSRGSLEHFVLPGDLVSRLKSFSSEEGVSLYVTLLAGFASVLHRYTEQDDIILGTLSAGRNVPAVEALAGDFVNPLALRIDLSGDPSFKELVARVREVVVNAVSHDGIPFQEVVKIVQPKLDPTRNPLFQIIFSLQPEMPRPYPGWNLKTEEVGNGGSKCDLIVVANIGPDQIFGPITYNSELFDPSTIDRLLGHWQTMLTGILANPECGISGLPLLSDAERNQILIEWNDTAAAFPAESCVHQMIAEQAEKTPDRIAVVCGRKELTYRELNVRANQVACYLRTLGVSSGDLVGVFLDRSPDLVVAILGILKSGAAYVPLDPGLPSERLDFIAKDAGLKVIATTEALRTRLEGLAGKSISLDSDWPRGSEESGMPHPPVSQCDLAYLIYTSGSTGQPKGVCIPHRALVNFLLSMRESPGLTGEDILLAVTTISFDIAGLELYLPLISGARCVLVGKDAVLDVQKLARLIDDSGATVMQATPATWRLLLESGWPGKKGLKVLCGGEAMPRELARQLLPLVGSLWNMYGPTETTIWSTVQQIIPDQEIISIGRPIANTQIYILDKWLQPLPIGASGDLYIGGDGLARGYHNRPDLTAERFLVNPFRDEPDARIYKTGDIARFHSNGEIECLGRSDEQVKIRGFRIELGEIEHALGACSGVRQAAVVAREDMAGEKRLVAYVVPSLQDAQAPGDLLNLLKKKLPSYMLPSTIISFDSLPTLPNGKIDRRALRSSKFGLARESKSCNLPQTATEQQLARIWSDVIGVEPIMREDNFFDLGGHSISAVRVVALIEKSHSVKLPLSALLQAPTLAELAKVISQKGLSAGWSCLVPIHPSGSRPPLFCVHGAGGTVLIYRDLARHLGPDQPVYGLQSQGLDGHRAYLTRVEDMATLYVSEIKKVQSRGPYYLGGYCMGGTVALEMAQQLVRRGEKVALLALLDTLDWSKLPSDSIAQKIYRQSERLTFHLQNFLLLNLKEKIKFFHEKMQTLRSRSKVWQGMVLGRLFPGQTRSQSSILADIWEINDRAASNYVPQPFPGTITDFRPIKQYSALLKPEMKWDQVAGGGQEIITLPVYPAGMLVEPFVKKLGSALRTSIDKANRGTSPAS